MIVSTGMADLTETKQAVEAIREEGNEQIIVLHSTSNYPPSPASLNLNVITTLWRELAMYDVLIGYSDNGSAGNIADIAAVALGACVVEKHFTLDSNMPGPDHQASLNPAEFAAFVQAIRETELMLGSFEKKCAPEEESVRAVGRKSIVARQGIPAGHTITQNDIIMKRPGIGIPPTQLNLVLGKTARRNIVSDTIIALEDIV